MPIRDEFQNFASMRSSDLGRGDIASLEQGFRGTVVLPSDPDYHQNRQLANRAFQFFPQLIAYCETHADVRKSLAFARERDMQVAIRSGGHCTAGFSANDGMVIDIGRLSFVQVDPETRCAVVGAGTRIGHFNTALDEYGLHVPGGCCNTVALAGHMQGGGYGFTSREFGMHLDSVTEVVLMTADGEIVTANESRNSDLFWAVRGGGSGNFGIVLQIAYTLHALGPLWGFGLKWPLSKAPEVLALMQKDYMKTGAPRQLGYMSILGWQDGEPCLMMRGMFDGSRASALEVLGPLIDLGAELELERTASYLELYPFIVSHTGSIPPVPDLARQEKQSAMIARDLDADDWSRIVNVFMKTPTPWNLLAIEPYGGRIADISADATAYIHRCAAMNLFLDVFWMNDVQHAAAIDYLDSMMEIVAPYSNGHQYQNYPRRGLRGHAHAYWGGAYERLRVVKSKYDPDHFFRFAHGIEPLSAAEQNVKSA